jgi:hypothetical protein
MRRLVIAGIVLALAGCKKSEASAPPAPAALSASAARAIPPAAAAAAAEVASVRGKIAERIDASQYSYLLLKTPAGDAWAAVSKTDRPVGAEVAVVNATWMENFHSATLNRTWDRIAFGVLDEGTAQVPPGHPAIEDPAAAKFATSAGMGQSPHQHPSPAAAADLGAIKLARAPGPQGRTVADVWRQRAALNDQTVAVRGKVVKATPGVLGKTWLHLRDGTGDGATADLAVASVDAASVGDTVLVTGVVHLDRDLGAGYRYDVIVEDARIKTE